MYGPFNIKGDHKYNASEKTYTYNLYDGFLNTMKDYKPITITYPCTVIGFFLQLISELGLTTSISSLPNGTRIMEKDIFDGINFTNRDVLDDIGKATGTLFEIDGIDVKVCELGLEENKATINDDILKNCNIDFGEHFGPINTIIISRSADSDYIYLSTIGTPEENRKAFRISDCQLMNENNRSDYLEELLNHLSGVEFDIFDTELVGYGGFTPLQKIEFTTGNKTYTSYVFNNEIEISAGYYETIFTDNPFEVDTDYKTSDSTDKRINEAYIIVNKQNKTISSLTKQVTSVSDTVTKDIYTKEQSNALVQNATDGLINKLQTSGGQNLLQNTALKNMTDSNYDFWTGSAEKVTYNQAVSLTAIKLKNGTFKQNLALNNGTYAIGLKYVRLLNTANASVKCNGKSFNLGESGTIAAHIDIFTGSFELELICDSDDGYLIYDVMLNKGSENVVWSQSANEINTDTVSIGKGISVENSNVDTKCTINADGVRVINENTNTDVMKTTDKGGFFDDIQSNTATIGGLSIKKVNGHVKIVGVN